MKTRDLQKYPLISEVPGQCPWLMATCSTCMYRREPEDYWQTDDDRSRCVYATKAELLGKEGRE